MAISDLIEYCNHRLRVEHGLTENLLLAGKRHVSARLGGIEFSSRFDAVRLTDAPALTVGHIARLRTTLPAASQNYGQGAPESNDPGQIVSFDRLCRTLHLLNYLNWRQDESTTLFLEVQARHILSLAKGHGAYFAGIIHRCGLTPSQIVLSTSGLFAASPGDYLRRLADGMANYRDRGYRLAIGVNEVPLAKPLSNFLFFIAPDYILLNAAHFDGTKRTVPAFHANHLNRLQRLADGFGGKVLLEGIDDEDAFALARASGIPLVQGDYCENRRKRTPRISPPSDFEQDAHV